MNIQIMKLAETMDANAFINELENREVDYSFDSVSNILNYNDGFMNVEVDDTVILFVDGVLDSISY